MHINLFQQTLHDKLFKNMSLMDTFPNTGKMIIHQLLEKDTENIPISILWTANRCYFEHLNTEREDPEQSHFIRWITLDSRMRKHLKKIFENKLRSGIYAIQKVQNCYNVVNHLPELNLCVYDCFSDIDNLPFFVENRKGYFTVTLRFYNRSLYTLNEDSISIPVILDEDDFIFGYCLDNIQLMDWFSIEPYDFGYTTCDDSPFSIFWKDEAIFCHCPDVMVVLGKRFRFEIEYELKKILPQWNHFDKMLQEDDLCVYMGLFKRNSIFSRRIDNTVSVVEVVSPEPADSLKFKMATLCRNMINGTFYDAMTFQIKLRFNVADCDGENHHNLSVYFDSTGTKWKVNY